MNKNIVLATAALALAVAGCTSTPTFQTGEDAEVTHDGLTRMEGTIMDAVWARTDIDLRGYNKIMFTEVEVEFRPVTGPYSGRAGVGATSSRRRNESEFQLDEATQQLVIEELSSVFLEVMQESEVFEIVDESGEDVLLIRSALLDIVSRVPPETVGRSMIFLDSVGEATLVLEIRDSVSKAVFARSVDRRAAGGQQTTMTESNRVTNRAEVRRLGRRWANIVRNGLETLMTDGLKEAS